VIEATRDLLGTERNGNGTLGRGELELILFGHSAFQYLHAGCVLGVFELLAEEPELTREEIAARTGLEPHAARCLLFGLSALRLLVKHDGTYANSAAIAELMADGTWETYSDTVLFEAAIAYPGEADFVESLVRGENVGLRRLGGEGDDLYRRVAASQRLGDAFFRGMSSWSRHAVPLLLSVVDFDGARHILDVGGGDGTTAVAIARSAPEARISILELPGTAERALETVAAEGLADRVDVLEGDMFSHPFPEGVDCVLLIHQLVIWPPESIRRILARAYEALEPGGRVVIFSSMAEDEEDGPLLSAMYTAYFVSVPGGGMIYPWKEYEQALAAVGFVNIERRPCRSWTPHGAVVATK
jgi:L-tyrosine C(3)-methyltransferase